MLTGARILDLIAELKPPLITNYRSVRLQIQPCGFDLTLAKVLESEVGHEAVDFTRAKQSFEEMREHDMSQPLQPLKRYVLVTNEEVSFPLYLTGMCITRSSLTRLGSVLGSGVVDAGFRGVLNFSYIGTVPVKFKQNDRFVQLLVFNHEPTFAYTGQYQKVLS